MTDHQDMKSTKSASTTSGSTTSCAMVVMRKTGLPDVEPGQHCEACGAKGTVGRVMLTSRDETRQEMYRYCLKCWPAEMAWFDARWEAGARNPFEFLARAHRERDDEPVLTDAPLVDQDPSLSTITFESATWHNANYIAHELMETIRLLRDRSQNLDELVDAAVQLAANIEEVRHTRVGKMPFAVQTFLLEFGSDTEPARAFAKRAALRSGGGASNQSFTTQRAAQRARDTSEFRAQMRAMDDDLAAAHADADALIAEFDRSLEALAVPSTPEAQSAVKKELVEMLQTLENEIASEAATLASWQDEMQAAAKAGDAYTAAKLNRLGEERMARIHDLRASMADVEVLHHRMLGSEKPPGDPANT